MKKRVHPDTTMLAEFTLTVPVFDFHEWPAKLVFYSYEYSLAEHGYSAVQTGEPTTRFARYRLTDPAGGPTLIRLWVNGAVREPETDHDIAEPPDKE